MVQGVGAGREGEIVGMVGTHAQDWRREPLSRGGVSGSAFSESTVMPHGDGGLGRARHPAANLVQARVGASPNVLWGAVLPLPLPCFLREWKAGL